MTSPAVDPVDPTAIAVRAATIVGADNVVRDEIDRAVYSQDIVQWDAPIADLVVRPGSVADVSALLQLAGEFGLAVAPRGGGLSYTRGYVPEKTGTMILDLTRLNVIHEVNEEDRYIALGPAVTWQQVMDELRPRGLRTVLTGPISGIYSTVGGAASQNIPGSMDTILGLEVVLADGRIVHTGSSAISRAESPFYRYYGPDLTGLFLGDTGTYGVKTRLTLRIEPIPEGVAFGSFAFETLSDMAAAMTDVSRLGVAGKSFGMDPLKNRTATKVGLREGAETLRDVARGSGSLVRGLKDAARIVAAGRDALDDVKWSLHLTVEGFDQRAADAAMAATRKACAVHGGRDIEPSIPIAMRAKPFSIRGFLGLNGESWVPVHGVFPMSKARDVVRVVESFFAERQPLLDEHDIQVSYLSSINGQFWLLEPMFYWMDAVSEFHMRYLDRKRYAKFQAIPANPDARAAVMRMRGELRDLFFGLGAVSAQIGKFYNLADALEPETYAVLTSIKDLLDPDRRLNPGNLGWR
ncbi:MAG: FAD-binding oxidoreductase [Alphaproteobacteria bacterium]|nr:FAD-binding oxidoreductase [Alphaproteobacteria bacterium]